MRFVIDDIAAQCENGFGHIFEIFDSKQIGGLYQHGNKISGNAKCVRHLNGILSQKCVIAVSE